MRAAGWILGLLFALALVVVLRSAAGERRPVRQVASGTPAAPPDARLEPATTLQVPSTRPARAEAEVRAEGGDARRPVPLAPGRGLRGRVLDDRGELFAGATAHLERRGDPSPAYELLCPDGTFELTELVPGVYACRASWKEQSSSRVELELGPGSTLELLLVRPARVRGRVLAPDGQPEARARVVATALPRRNGGRLERYETVRACDDSGGFVLDDVPSGQVFVDARSDRDCPSERVELFLAPGETRALELRLRRAGRITGEVQDDQGLPVAQAEVQVEGLGFTARADALGRFTFEQMPPGRHALLRITPRGEPPRRELRAEATLAEGEHAHVVLGGPGSEEPLLALRGRVLAHGAPVVGAEVRLVRRVAPHARVTTTETTGRFTLELAQDERIHLSVTPTNGVTTYHESEGVPEDELLIELPTGGVSGRALRSDGSAWGGARIELYQVVPGFSLGTTESSDDGSFRFSGLASGKFSVSATARSGRDPEAPARQEFKLLDGAEAAVTLVQPPTCRLRGTVRDDAGRLRPKVEVQAVGPENRIVRAEAGPEAIYVLGGLEPGLWVVTAFAGELVSARLELELAAGETAADLVLLPAPELVVQVIDGSGAGLENVRVSVTDGLGRIPAQPLVFEQEASERRFRLPPGEYRVVALAREFPAHAEAHVRLAGTRTETLVLVLQRPDEER